MNRVLRRASRVLAVVALAACCLPAAAATYYVRQSGSDQAAGTSPQAAFKTVVRAAQAMNHGDAIVIGPGRYREAVLIAERFGTSDAPVRITGDESGGQTGDRPGPVVIEPAGEMPALWLYRVRDAVVAGLTFRGVGEGLRLDDCRTARVERCTFSGLAKGLTVAQCRDVRVECVVIERCTIGAQVGQSVGTRIAHATVAGSTSVGIFLLSCGQGTIRNSIMVQNNTSLVADAVSAASWTSDCNAAGGTMGAWGAVPATYNAYEWFAASGMERHSAYVAPAFVDPAKGDLHVDPSVTWGGGLPGGSVGAKLDPEVKLDRDGRPFALRDGAVCAGAYQYPEPRPGKGWKALGIRLAPEGPRQSAGVYQPDGTLVRMLVADAAGVRDLWWDGLDDSGRPAPAGPYVVRSIAHDVRLLNDGHLGDNGNPLGTYNCDNADRVVAFPDGSFVISTVYDEAGIPVRFYAPSGQPVSGSGLADKDIWAMAADADAKALICGVGRQLHRIVPPGERTRMANGAESYPLLAGGETLGTEADGKTPRRPSGLAVVAGAAYVALPGLDLVRGIDLAAGQKRSEGKVPAVADLARDEKGTLWAIAGADVVALTPQCAIAKRYPTGLKTPRYLAAGSGRLAVIDRAAAKIALLDAATGRTIRVLGKDRPAGRWLPVAADLYRDPRGAAFLPDGRLLLTESGRVRAFWPESAQESLSVLSNFMDAAVPHPAKPEYVYCYSGNVFHVDPQTDAWTWKLEAPPHGPDAELHQMSCAVTLGGRHYLLAHNRDRAKPEPGKPAAPRRDYCLIDVTEPLAPRLAGLLPVPDRAYYDARFTKDGHLVLPGEGLQFKIVPFKGLDPQQNPVFDFENPRTVGPKAETASRAMTHKGGVTADLATGNLYYLAVTAAHNKMVPFWGASGSGVGRSKADGSPLWFSLSSGGNCMSIASIRDRNGLWVMAAKDFGGQIDVFDSDGLRLTTSNWNWPGNWQCGFVDLRDGLQAFLRPDGKPGVWVEDDAIGRFLRCRMDGGETVRRATVPLAWTPTGAAAGPAPTPDRAAGSWQSALVLPKVAELKVDGDWSRWEAAGVTPQIICLPVAVSGRAFPPDLMQTFRAGTAVGALAHDGKNVYAYFLVADDTMHFDDDTGARMWEFDSVELWLEEEQIGLGLRKDGRPAVFKYRFHDRAGKQYAAGYPLADAGAWGKKLASLADHGLSRYLARATGTSFEGRPGYAVMGKIPMEEIKLVGGISGRKGADILPMTGQAGEILRVGVAIGGISYWGREQDFKVNWPSGFMFSDPTRSVPFVLGPQP